MSRRLLVGTGWKMNLGAAKARAYAQELREYLAGIAHADLDIFVLPPFTSLHAANAVFAGSAVAIGGQTMHWDEAGAWTGEISAGMLVEAGCRYVELAHSERLAHFGETYERVRLKVDAAVRAGLISIVCLGETAVDKAAGRADETLEEQLLIVLDGRSNAELASVVLAYEPRWAIGQSEAATPEYVAARHAGLRERLRQSYGDEAAGAMRIIYGGSVTPGNGAALLDSPDVDGLFIGRAAWSAEGFATMIRIVATEAAARGLRGTTNECHPIRARSITAAGEGTD